MGFTKSIRQASPCLTPTAWELKYQLYFVRLKKRWFEPGLLLIINRIYVAFFCRRNFDHHKWLPFKKDSWSIKGFSRDGSGINQSSSKNRSLKHSLLKRLFLTKSVLSFLTAPVHEWPLRDYIQNLVLRKCYFRLILFSIKFELLLFLRKFSKIERLNFFTKRMLILIYCKIYFWDELRNSIIFSLFSTKWFIFINWPQTSMTRKNVESVGFEPGVK